MATVTDVLDLARSQLGVCENPMGSNSGTPYHAWYGVYSQGWQWCAIFVTWVLHHVDPELFWGLRTAYSGDFLRVGRIHRREIDISEIAPGDICIWDQPIGGITDHIGFVESVTAITFTTIEGNSGDCVRRNRDRPRKQTSKCHYYFVRPNYSTPKPATQEVEMATVTSGVPTTSFGGIFQVGTMDGRPWDVWAKAQNPTSKPIDVEFSCTTNDSHEVVTVSVPPNQIVQKQASKDLKARGNSLIVVRPKVAAIVTLDHRPSK